MKPVVAIVGRPNVGKSTLFNRIVGGRRAIALDQPGVSRDRHYGHASWDGRELIVVDTGGFPSEPRVPLQKKIRQQIDFAIDEASVILFVMDGKGGLVPAEREIAETLRRSGKRVVYVVNKIDRESHEERLADFYPLGGDLHPVSAEHGRGIGELLDEVVRDFQIETTEEQTRAIRIAIIGRPNVGKSSLLNRLVGEERVVVDESPGTTRDVIDTSLTRDDRRYRLLDTAGIRRKGKWVSEIERVSVIKTIQSVERADLCLLVLDASEGILQQDAHVAGYAHEAGRGVVVLWNKWDLVLPEERGKIKQVEEKLPFLSGAPVLPVSAKTGFGTDRIWSTVDKLFQACGRKIKTHELNDVLGEAVLAHNRPSYKGKEVKFLYGTQVGTFPPRFAIFVNEPKGVHFSYERYLANRLREAFSLEGAPVQLMFRKKN